MLKRKAPAHDEPYRGPSADDILSRVAACSLSIDWRAGSSLTQPGLRQSRLPGDQGDFHALKPFAPGDRARSINWRATAATGAQEVLREVRLEEQPIDVFVIVNTGRSMDFGTVRALKRHVAAEVTAAVALSAGQSKDRLGFITYGDSGVENSCPARSPEQQVLPAIGAVLERNDISDDEPDDPAHNATASGADLAQALSCLPRRRSLVFVVSDFFECDNEDQQASLEAAATDHQLVAIHIEDPRENELPDGFGIISLAAIGGAAGKTVLLTSSCRRQFAAQARQRKLGLQALFQRLDISWIAISTADRLEAHADRLQSALDAD